ncbi:hypothetical protein [uncultured Nostoc sp.]|uniref:hypothetical protein n=1 Tax=uncultured Nostoc sp. TaxID=340711 RepID=UPI002618B16E|nr:hypothetical protein [uncultured Nostoc sp.]
MSPRLFGGTTYGWEAIASGQGAIAANITALHLENPSGRWLPYVSVQKSNSSPNIMSNHQFFW